jgi:N-acetylglucosamine malate deacetylase 1
MKKNIKKILVVAAHPDDEILGCGGTLIKMRKAGYKIKCIFISDGESSRNIKDKKKLLNIIEEREKQAVQVSKLLKFDKPSFFRLPDNKLDTVPLIKIIRIIENEIKILKPSIIFTHSQADLNIDHSLLCKAVLTGTRPFSKTFIKKILSFEVASNSELYFSNNKKFFRPNFFCDISKEIKIKLKSLKIYKNEIRKAPHSRSLKGVENLAKYRGSQSGTKFSEAFEVLREII